jgi:outer membrane protein
MNSISSNLKLLLLFSFCFLLPISYQAQEVKKFSLEQAISYALENNYTLKNAGTDVGIAKMQVRETTAIGLPQVSASAFFQNFLDIPTQVLPANAFNPAADPSDLVPLQFGTDYAAQGKIDASQLLFDGSYIVGLRAAKTFQLFSKQNLDRNKADVANEVKQAYFTSLVATENHQIILKTYANIEKNLQDTKIMFQEGLVEEQDAEQLELTLLNLKNNLNRAEKQKDISEKLLKFRLGIDLDTPIELTDALDKFIEENKSYQQEIAGLDLNSHIDYKLSDTRVKLDELNMQRYRSEYLPKLNAFFSYRQDAFRNDLDFGDSEFWFPATVWGLSLNMPIFSSGMKSAKIQQAKMEVEKSKTNRDMAEQNIKLQIASAKNDFETAKEQYINQRKSLDLAERILNKTIIKNAEGVASNFELTQIQNQFLETQGAYVNALFDLLNSKANLERALGN